MAPQKLFAVKLSHENVPQCQFDGIWTMILNFPLWNRTWKYRLCRFGFAALKINFYLHTSQLLNPIIVVYRVYHEHTNNWYGVSNTTFDMQCQFCMCNNFATGMYSRQNARPWLHHSVVSIVLEYPPLYWSHFAISKNTYNCNHMLWIHDGVMIHFPRWLIFLMRNPRVISGFLAKRVGFVKLWCRLFLLARLLRFLTHSRVSGEIGHLNAHAMPT